MQMQEQISKGKINKKSNLDGFKKVLTSWRLYVFLIPGLLVTIIFKFVPLYGIQLAFKDFIPGKPISEAPWIGFEHFIRFFTTPDCLQIIWNTVKVALVTNLVTFPIPIILAIMLNQVKSTRRKKLVQNITYMPYLFSVVVVMSVASILLAPNSGVINILIQKFGGEQILFYGHDKYVLPIYVTTELWSTMGFGAVLYLSALSSIDQEQLEAARIDGASRMRIIWNIELPAIADTIIIVLILNVGSLLSVGVDKMLLIQTNLNLGASETIGTYVYKMGLVQGDFGFSTAISLFNNVVNIMCLLVVNQISKKISGSSVL